MVHCKYVRIHPPILHLTCGRGRTQMQTPVQSPSTIVSVDEPAEDCGGGETAACTGRGEEEALIIHVQSLMSTFVPAPAPTFAPTEQLLCQECKEPVKQENKGVYFHINQWFTILCFPISPFDFDIFF